MTTKSTETTHAQQTIEMANATLETARGFFQQILDAQLAGFEQAVAQLDELTKRGATRVQGNLDEAMKLSRGAIGWATEMQAEVTKAALQAVRGAASWGPKATA